MRKKGSRGVAARGRPTPNYNYSLLKDKVELGASMMQNMFSKQTAVMNYVSKFLTNFKEFYNEINSATLTGAIDVVIVQQEDGSYTCSPFHVRFGKIGVLRSREKVVDIEINGEPLNIHMKLGETGEAFFVEELEDSDEVPSHLATSPIPTYPDIEQELAKLKASNEIQNNSEDFRIDKPEVSSRETSVDPDQVCIQIDDANHPVSLQGSIYYETTDSVVPACTSAPVSVTITPNQDSTPKLLPDEPANKFRFDEDQTVPILNMASIAKAFGHTSISDSALAAIDSSNRIMHYSKPVASESSSLSSNHFLPMFQKDGDVQTNSQPILYQGSAGSASKTFVPSHNTLEDQMGMTDEDKLKSKKKRRKKSIIRKRKSREAAAQQAGIDSSDDEPEEIFQMDVDDDESQTKITSSMPIRKTSIPLSSRTLEKLHSGGSLLHDAALPSTSSGIRTREWQFNNSLPLNLESHPFSDGDVTPIMSPVTSRPPTPKSDTEYENRRHGSSRQTENTDDRWSWTWGELPVPPKTSNTEPGEPLASDDEGAQSKKLETEQEEQRSMLGGMFRFMRKTKKLRHQPESEGIYLDDLNLEELDPEIAKLYFPPRNNSGLLIQSSAIKTPSPPKDEDVESGNGSSLPQSPHSEGGIGSIHGGIDSDSDERHPIFDFKGYNDLAISLCGGLADFDGDIPQERFLHSLITYDDFCENPNVLNNPDLVVRLNNRYFNWSTVAPMVLSLILYQRPLSERTVSSLVTENMPKKPKKSETKSYSSWFSWRRSGTTEDEPKHLEDRKKTDSESSSKAEVVTIEPEVESKSGKEAAPEPEPEPEPSTSVSVTPSENIPVPTERVTIEEIAEVAYASTSSDTDEVVIGAERIKVVRERQDKPVFKGTERYRKSLRLTSEQISQLNLRAGPNEVVFSVTTAYQGTTRCKCHIYLWNHDDKIVVSDIDGTITKSDVLGHILPIIGKDWAQSGVAQLFTKIKNNGYQFLYLSARAIGQAHITREYLKSVKQGDVCLPEGPLLLNPSSLLSALHREVIEKKPEEFKISCLRDIQALFPSNINPFYAGYGNRVNDVWAYRAVGIPYSRTFTINHKGELKHELTNTFQSTYTGLSNVVDHLFPPLRRSPMRDGVLTSDFEGPEEFSSFTYWRPPIPEVNLEDSPTRQVTERNKQVEDKKVKQAVG